MMYSSSNRKAEDIQDLLRTIIANAEFLEVLFGENEYLKNILHAADKTKLQVQDVEEGQKYQMQGD